MSSGSTCVFSERGVSIVTLDQVATRAAGWEDSRREEGARGRAADAGAGALYVGEAFVCDPITSPSVGPGDHARTHDSGSSPRPGLGYAACPQGGGLEVILTSTIGREVEGFQVRTSPRVLPADKWRGRNVTCADLRSGPGEKLPDRQWGRTADALLWLALGRVRWWLRDFSSLLMLVAAAK